MNAPESQVQEQIYAEDFDGNIHKQFSTELSSGDELVTKVRKPYTITKQRERWTEEEHLKFLEALKLYGRAWRRIEEHIGTKTAVQIRSHAQKFFAKLEREQANSAGKSPTIDIPPPRPKRKPSHPYPRKATEANSQTILPSAASLSRPPVLDPRTKASGFAPYDTSGKNSPRDVATNENQPELKLFGHTVVIPTVARAVPNDIAKQSDAEHELEDDSAPPNERTIQSSESPGQMEPKAKIPALSNSLSEISTLELEKYSSNSQSGDALTKGAWVAQASNISEEHIKTGMHLNDRLPVFDFAGRCYMKFLEGVQGAAVPPFFPWQQAGLAAAAAAWPGGSVSEVLKTMFMGLPAEACKPENSAALAAATIAAASAWWTLQGAIPPAFGETIGLKSSLRQDNAMQENRKPHGQSTCETKGDGSNQASCKRNAREELLERTVKSRKLNRSDGNETEDNQVSSPGGAGSEGGAGSNEVGESVIIDGDASNSGDKFSRCGAAFSDKEKGKQEKLNMVRTLPHASSCNGLNRSKQQPVRGQKAARLSRTGSDMEQRKEVSQEGRMAFQALFSHEKLPQTFGKPKAYHSANDEAYHRTNDECQCNTEEAEESSLDNCKECGERRKPLRIESVGSNSGFLLQTGSGSCSTSSRSGFVPYRRAAEAEIKASTPNQIAGAASGGNCCGMEENRVLGTGWCSLEEEVVKQN